MSLHDDDVPLTGITATPKTGVSVSTPYISFEAPRSVRRRKADWIGAGWIGGARLALAGATAVLIFNIVLTLVIYRLFSHTMQGGIGMVFRGSCEDAEQSDTMIHLAINVIATVLLASSNYCMQLLSAPSRSEIDEAHAQGRWLDIGIPSVRNLRLVTKKKIILWWMLGVSSLPLHLV